MHFSDDGVTRDAAEFGRGLMEPKSIPGLDPDPNHNRRVLAVLAYLGVRPNAAQRLE